MSKKIIICADGTWNDPEQLDRGSLVPTNVVKFARALALADQPDQEHIFYDLGVGTGNWLDKRLGGMTGKGLIHNIFECYYFIAERYQPGDKIYLLGFSRGAYTVRSLAGLICSFGLDKSLYNEDFEVATKATPAIVTEKNRPVQDSRKKIVEANQKLEELKVLFKNMKLGTDEVTRKKYFEHHECHYPGIDMIGVWDTVGALGIPLPLPNWLIPQTMREAIQKKLLGKYRFLNVELNEKVASAYHAISIDENRDVFKPTLWRENQLAPHQKVRQVWFAGIHSNVGGGYADCGLSDNALLWMIKNAEEQGLVFNKTYLDKVTHPDSFYGEIRDERAKHIKRLMFKKGIRQIELVCKEAGVTPIIAKSAIQRQKSKICKKKYFVTLPVDYLVEEGF